MPKKTASPAVIYELKYPFSFGSEEIKTIEFSRPKGKHIKHLGSNITLEATLKVASKISGHVPAVFDEMDAVDVMKIAEIVGTFLDDGHLTGKIS